MSCPDCFKGHVHPGTAKGSIKTLHGLETYTAQPPSSAPSKGIIVIIPDAFGIEFINNKILADHYAAKGGYTVHLPDFMAGASAPVGLLDSIHTVQTLDNWATKLWHIPYVISSFVRFLWTNRFGLSYPRVKSFIQALHAANPSTPIFVAGFCWGGKHLILLSADAEMHSLITAGFTAHPSQLSIPDDIHSLNNPVSFALGENDNSLKKESREQIEKIMEGKDGECVTYAGVGHGFAVRADPSRDEAREAAERAEDQCLSFFDRHRPR